MQFYNGSSWFSALIASAATLITDAAYTISNTSVTIGGESSGASAFTITARGICWNTTAATVPTVADSIASERGTIGAFSSSLDGLTASTM